MTALHSIALNYNSAAPVKTDLIFKTGDKGITFNFAIKGLDTTGMTAKIAFNRSNATSVEAALTGSGEAWTYTTLGNEFAVPGVVVADVKFYNNDESQRVSTASFILGVIGDTLDGLGGGTAGYSDELEVLREEMEEAADTLEAYIEAYGDRGPLNPRGNYDPDEEYTVCDVVYHNNTSWINRVPCSGEEPTTSSAYWQKMIDEASGGAQELNDLDDVSVSSPTDGQAMIYDGTNQVWTNQAIPTGSATLAGLTDVDVTGVQNGQIVKYNSTTQKWEAANESGGGGASDLDDLSDVDLSSPTNGQVLTYNSATSKWENQTNTAAGFKPYIVTTAATGATVTYSKGGTSITATEVSTGTFKADVTDYGTWTVTATLNGQTATTTVNVESVGKYTASAAFFSATINVTTWPTDGSVRLFVGSLSWSTEVIATSATTSITVPEAGTYYVVAEGGGTNIKDVSVVITTDGQTENVDLRLAQISLSFADEFRGQVIQLSKTGSLYSFTAPAAGNSMLLYAPDSDTWTIQANYSGTTYTTTAATTVGSTVSATLALTPPIPMKTFAAATDAEIAQMVAAADAGEIDLIDDCGWAVGQEHQVSLSAIAASGTYDGVSWNVGEAQAAQTITLVLMHGDRDGQGNDPAGLPELVTSVTNKDGTTRTTAHFVVGVKDCLGTNGYVVSSGDYSGSWNTSNRRAWCNSGFRAALPSDIRDAFKMFKCVTAQTYNGSTNQTTQDYFALPAAAEVFKGDATYGQGGSAGTQTALSNLTEFNALTRFQHYETTSNRVKKVNNSNVRWWERSPYYNSSSSICGVSEDNGNAVAPNAGGNQYISPFGVL